MPVGCARLLQEGYVWEPVECVVYLPIPILGFVAGCCSFVCGVLPCHVSMLCSQLPSAVQNSDSSGTLK